jgi:hypothetical protein
MQPALRRELEHADLCAECSPLPGEPIKTAGNKCNDHARGNAADIRPRVGHISGDRYRRTGDASMISPSKQKRIWPSRISNISSSFRCRWSGGATFAAPCVL